VSSVNPKPIIEALLLATHEPLSAQKLASLIEGTDTKQIRQYLEELRKEYDESGRGFTIQEVAGGYQFLTRPDYVEYIKALHKAYAKAKLSQAALETLAIIAYKQPVLRAEIEAIRGVQAGPLLRTLMDRGLVKIVGRADTLGRPALYGTTRQFLERFMLKSLKELPKSEGLENWDREAGEKEAAGLEEAADTPEPAEANTADGLPDGERPAKGTGEPAGEASEGFEEADATADETPVDPDADAEERDALFPEEEEDEAAPSPEETDADVSAEDEDEDGSRPASPGSQA
jgi:segregation and condensation protein B